MLTRENCGAWLGGVARVVTGDGWKMKGRKLKQRATYLKIHVNEIRVTCKHFCPGARFGQVDRPAQRLT